MTRMFLRAVAGMIALGLAGPITGNAQETPAAAAGSAQLAAILAPVALYLDPVLSNILTASTYPLEVVEATRWLSEPGNDELTGDMLLSALQQKDWDPSVKSLVPFPPILKLMNDQLDWTQQVGNAFLAQQGDVMDAVQTLRRQAQAADGLVSTPQQTVRNDDGTVQIQPADPEQVAIPAYDPTVVYGAWPYPEAPPAAFAAYDPGDYDSAFAGGWFFGPPILLESPVWFWSRFDWRDHRIDMDRDRVVDLNPFRPYIADTIWHHDPAHRHGVAYRDLTVQQHFQSGRPAIPRPLPTIFTGTPSEPRPQSVPQRGSVAPLPAINRPPAALPPVSTPRPAQGTLGRPPAPTIARPIIPGQYYRAEPLGSQPATAQYPAPAGRPQGAARSQQPVSGDGRPSR
ncbi:MAG: DUF3300 domain-containing protein [Aliidongia sp.]